MTRLIGLLLLAAISGPAMAQQAAGVPGEPQAWFLKRAADAAPLAPTLADLREEALFRARWSTTIQPCAAPPENLRLYGLRPVTADRLVTNGILADAFSAAWTFYAETDCPETPLLRYMYVLETAGTHVMMVVNRGQTIATPSMMRETSAIAGADAFEAAKARQPDCSIKSVGMREARIERTDASLGPDIAGTRFTGGWSEIWAFRACQQDVNVRVRFDTDGKGGTTARVQNAEIVG